MNVPCSLHLLFVIALLATSLSHAQTPGAALDAAWVTVCARAEPGSPFFQRCQEIINAGPGGGDRRSEAALGNNLNTVSGQGRGAASGTGDSGRIEWGRSGMFFGFTSRGIERPGDALEAGFDGSALSAIVGYDRRLGTSHVLGLTLNHQRESADFDDGAGRTRSRNLGLLATYGGGFGDAWSLDAYAGALRGNLDIDRQVRYDLLLNAGSAAQSSVRVQGLAEAATDSQRTVAGVALNYMLNAGAWDWQFGGGYDLARSRIDAYVERGGAGLALAVDRQRVNSSQGRVGLRASHTGSTHFGVLQPYFGIDGFREFADDARELQVAFAGDQALNRIRFDTARPDRSWAEAAVGLVATLAGGNSAFIEYRQRFGHELLDERALSIGLRVEFD